MKVVVVKESEYFDEETQTFSNTKRTSLYLEHSLVSISKWESKWRKPFLKDNGKTKEEILDYIKCMVTKPVVDENVFYVLTEEHFSEITNYLNEEMTATTFWSRLDNSTPRRPSRETITSELIYYWMIQHQIPFECAKWHINRLFTLIRVCSIKNTPPNKTSTKGYMNQIGRLNSERKKTLNTRG